MMRVSVLVGVGIALITSCSVTFAGDNKKQTIQKIYNKISVAYSQKDIDTIVAVCADDYQVIRRDGTIETDGKAAERERLEKVMSRSSSIVDKTIVLSLTPIGKDVAVVIKKDYTRIQESEQGLVGKFHQVGTYREFWVNTDGSWLLKRSRGLLITTTKSVNGKPVR